jgi:K(+)-stimulated pyrophosphate-energized sodium pump
LNFSSHGLLRLATVLSVGSYIGFSYVFFVLFSLPFSLLYTMIIGCLSGLLVGAITEYYTGGSPIKKLAEREGINLTQLIKILKSGE